MTKLDMNSRRSGMVAKVDSGKNILMRFEKTPAILDCESCLLRMSLNIPSLTSSWKGLRSFNFLRCWSVNHFLELPLTETESCDSIIFGILSSTPTLTSWSWRNSMTTCSLTWKMSEKMSWMSLIFDLSQLFLWREWTWIKVLPSSNDPFSHYYDRTAKEVYDKIDGAAKQFCSHVFLLSNTLRVNVSIIDTKHLD